MKLIGDFFQKTFGNQQQTKLQSKLSIIEKKAFNLVNSQNFDELVKQFTDYNINPNIQDEKGTSILMEAFDVSLKNLELGMKFIKFLLSKGANVDLPDITGRTVFLMACHWEEETQFNEFLQFKPNINAVADNNQGFITNPLFSLLVKKSFKMAYKLMELGADVDLVFLIQQKSNLFKMDEEALDFITQYHDKKQRKENILKLIMVRQLQQQYIQDQQNKLNNQQKKQEQQLKEQAKQQQQQLEEQAKYQQYQQQQKQQQQQLQGSDLKLNVKIPPKTLIAGQISQKLFDVYILKYL